MEDEKPDFGTWSQRPEGPEEPESPEPPKQTMSRRDFLKNAGKGTAAAVVLSQPGVQALENFAEGIDKSKSTETEKSESPPSYVIDYFGGETEEATKDRLINTMDANLEPLNNIDFSSFGEGDEDDIIRAIRIYQQVGSNELLSRLVLDQAVDIAGSHGEFVEEHHKENLQRLTNREDDNTERIGLQNSIDNYGMTVDDLGNIHATIDVDPQRLQDSFPEDMSSEGVIVGAFQLGKVELSYTHTRVRDPEVTEVEYNGKLYFVWGTEGVPNAQIIPRQTESGFIVDVNGVPTENFVESDVDPYDNQAIDKVAAEISNDVKQKRLEKILNDEEKSLYMERVPVEDRVAYVEPYNNQKNLDLFHDFCSENPEMVVVQAMGNNTDTRNFSKEDTRNGILVSGVGGSPPVRRQKFGTETSRSVGGIGADIYVECYDFHDILEEDYVVMSSSEATAIVGAYAKVLKGAGLKADQVKQALMENCCNYVQPGEDDNRLFAGSGEQLSGYVFSKEKADQYVASLSKTSA